MTSRDKAVEARVTVITDALLHLPVRGAALEMAARQVELALRELDAASAAEGGEAVAWGMTKEWFERKVTLEGGQDIAIGGQRYLPPAYGGCTCACHRQPGIIHFVACCHPPSPSPQRELEERIAEILDEDAPDKWVWKTHQSQDEWLRGKILPLLRDLRAAINPSAGEGDTNG